MKQTEPTGGADYRLRVKTSKKPVLHPPTQVKNLCYIPPPIFPSADPSRLPNIKNATTILLPSLTPTSKLEAYARLFNSHVAHKEEAD